jgi:multiple sugar transport system substrate-binding protein
MGDVKRFFSIMQKYGLAMLLFGALALTMLPVTGQAEENIKLVLSIGPRGFGEVAPDHIKGFMQKHPNIEVEWLKISDVPNESRNFYVTNLTAKNSTPDVIAVDVIWPGDFAKRGWIEPLEEYFDQKEINQYIPDFASAAMVDGKLYAIPLYMDGTHLFYRKDLLEKYSFEPPKTWEELIMQAKTITEGEDNPDLVGFISMWAKIEGLFMNWLSFFYGAGGQFFDAEGNLTVNSPEGINALQTMVDILYKHKITNDSILTYRPDDARVLFQQERAVFLMVQDFVWAALTADDSPVKDKVEFTRNPYFEGHSEGHSTAIGGFLLTINANSEHKQEAAELIRYFTSYDAQLKAALISAKAPTISAVYNDPTLAEKRPDLAKLGKNFDVGVVRPSAQTGAKYPQVSEIMQLEITAALHQQKTPEQALTDAETQLKALLP